MTQDVLVWGQHPEQWEQVPQAPGDVTVIAGPGRPETAQLKLDGVTYDRVPDTGWTMLVAWLAGRNHLVRLPDNEQHTVVTPLEDGTTTSTSEPWNQSDQDMIDDGIDEYLADAQVPSPPRGYRWYQRPPVGYDNLDDAYTYINRAIQDSDPENKASRPDQLAPLAAQAVAALYPG